ncbi:hypothetical protein M3Y98_00403400 [Aphelenchoides besseyi]|nr:hypothetical protein M3Y98_00403400 [Aphelenchoides besseyi]KAI6202238.1 hypothetical protein M3Y96_00927100 [Aphelenchoides besseyi]
MGNDQSVSVGTKHSVSSMPTRDAESFDATNRPVPRRSFDQRQSHQYGHKSQKEGGRSSTPQRKQSEGHHPHRNSSDSIEVPLAQRRKSCTPKHSVSSLTSKPFITPSSSSSLLSGAPTRGRASFSVTSIRDSQPSDWREEKQSPLLAFCNSYQHFQQQQRDPLIGGGYRRRMSVDESQQQRMRTTAAGGVNERGGISFAKLSLAGIPPSGPSFSSSTSGSNTTNTMTNGMVEISRSRINKAARDFTETGDFGLSLQEHLKLTSYQALMLSQTWPRVKSSVFSGVFRELSQKCPKVKELFQKTSIVGGFSANKCFDIKEHIKLVIELFDLCLQEMNSPCKTSQDRCIAIGETHFTIIGPAASGIWDDLGVCLTESISKADAIRGKREAFKAYIALTSFLVDSMKAGYQAQAKRKSLTRMSNGHVPSYGR